MASVDECRAALAGSPAAWRPTPTRYAGRSNVDRTLVCRVTDLGIAFRGRLRGGELVDVAEGDDPEAQIALTASSDDLIALVDGELDFPTGVWRAPADPVSIANPLDLLKLRKRSGPRPLPPAGVTGGANSAPRSAPRNVGRAAAVPRGRSARVVSPR